MDSNTYDTLSDNEDERLETETVKMQCKLHALFESIKQHIQ